MNPGERPMDAILQALQERAKELNCLYRVDELLSRAGIDRDDALPEPITVIPAGWQYPQACRVRLVLDGRAYQPADWQETAWAMRADVRLKGEKIGELTVAYLERFPQADDGPFLKEERRLINAIVERLGYAVMQRRLRRAVAGWRTAIATLLRQKQIAFAFHPDPDLPLISGMSDEMRQVVLNLFLNAIEVMKPEGRLIVWTRSLHQQEEVCLTVKDTGPGIDPGLLSQIFDAFITDKQTGTGLGLTITRATSLNNILAASRQRTIRKAEPSSMSGCL